MRIVICGEDREGKSCVAALIAVALKGRDIDVEIRDGDPDTPSQKNAKTMIGDFTFRDRCLRAVATQHSTLRKAITIETVLTEPEPKVTPLPRRVFTVEQIEKGCAVLGFDADVMMHVFGMAVRAPDLLHRDELLVDIIETPP